MSGSFYYSTNHPAYMQALLFFRLPSQQFQHHGNGTIGCGGHRQQPIQHPSGKKIGAKKHKRSRQQKPDRTDLLYPLFPPVSSFLRNPRRQVCLCRSGCKRNGVHDLRAEMQPAAQFRCRKRPVDTAAARPLPPSTGIWPTVLQPTKAPATVSVFLREAAVLPLPGAKTPVAEASFLFAQ